MQVGFPGGTSVKEPTYQVQADLRERVSSLLGKIRWRMEWQPTLVFLPGESQAWGSLVGCRLWGRTESDTTEVT